VHVSWIALVLGPGLEAGHAPPLVSGVESQLEADRIVYAAEEAHAGVGLFFHDHSFLCGLRCSIDAGIGQTSWLANRIPNRRWRTCVPGHRFSSMG
jgi:hypothetical protein